MTHQLTGYQVRQARDFVNGRETSVEIGAAILELAGYKYVVADRIWAEPTTAECATVEARAWQFAEFDESELHWGQSTIHRAA